MRVQPWLFVGGIGLVLGVVSQLDACSPVVAAALTLGGTVVLGLLAHGGVPVSPESVTLAAGGALAYEGVRPYLPLAATGLLLAFIFATRAMRSRSIRELVLHLGVAFSAGVAASWVVTSNQGLDTSLWLVAVMIAALVASIPWILPADAPRTFALRRLAHRSHGPMRTRMLRAVVAHRTLAELDLPKPLRVRVEGAVDELRRRVATQRGWRATSDSVRRQVDQLTRVARAARTRDLLMDGLEADEESLALDTDALEAEVAALTEMRP
ncbi:MAG: hypothetical protein AB8I08_30625 [Sandaracinaceae bacterium]